MEPGRVSSGPTWISGRSLQRPRLSSEGSAFQSARTTKRGNLVQVDPADADAAPQIAKKRRKWP